MNLKNLTNYYVWIIKAFVFAIPFLSIWISKSMFFPYITGRNFGFRILIEIALVLWVALMVLNREYRPKMTPIVWAILIFTAVVGIADLLGVDSYLSFWSRLERMEGYLMILHLAAYFLILTNVFRTKKEWLTFLNLFVLAGLIVGFYGLLQVFGLKEAIQGGGVRIDGTIGNPTYLAAYLTLIIVAALISFLNTGKNWLKYFYGGAIAYALFIMYFTASRGATLSFLVAIPVFAILYLILFKGEDDREKLFKKIAAAALIFIVVAPVSLWLLRNTSFIQDSEVLSRLTSISFGEKTIRSRFIIWELAWKAFSERPILGWGQENFLEAFSKHYDPRLYDQEPWFDRPHNIVFEWLINAGIIGLISYLSLFAALYWGIISLLKKQAIGKKEGLVLLVAPVAYFLQNFFVFDNFNTYVIFFALLAYVNSLVVFQKSAEVKSELPQKDYSQLSLGILIVGLILMSGVIYFMNIKPILAARGIITSLKSTAITGDPVTATLASFKKTLSYKTFARPEALEQLLRTATLLISRSEIPNSSKVPFWELAITETEAYLEKFPQNARVHLMLASLYHGLRNFNPDFIFRAREEIKTALSLSPKKQQIIFLLADNYLATNELDKATEIMQSAVALEPLNRDAQTNLAIVAMFAGKNDVFDKAMEDLNSIRLNTVDKKYPDLPLWNYINDLKKIADAYLNIGRPSGAQVIYNKIAALESEAAAFNITNQYKELLKNLNDRIRE